MVCVRARAHAHAPVRFWCPCPSLRLLLGIGTGIYGYKIYPKKVKQARACDNGWGAPIVRGGLLGAVGSGRGEPGRNEQLNQLRQGREGDELALTREMYLNDQTPTTKRDGTDDGRKKKQTTQEASHPCGALYFFFLFVPNLLMYKLVFHVRLDLTRLGEGAPPLAPEIFWMTRLTSL